MPITRQPKPLPSPLTYVPPASVPYKVTDNDSFYTLASRADMKARGVSASDLCLFNFCRKMTHEGLRRPEPPTVPSGANVPHTARFCQCFRHGYDGRKGLMRSKTRWFQYATYGPTPPGVLRPSIAEKMARP
jgi:hypothetical protein